MAYLSRLLRRLADRLDGASQPELSVDARGKAPLGDTTTATLSQAVEVTLDRIERVNEMTEAEVLATAVAVGKIVEVAKQQTAQARRSLESLVGNDSDGVTLLVKRQSSSTTQYLADVDALLARQAESAARARSLSHKIVDLGDQIAAVSFDARLLSLNASIESGRLGEAGVAFRVISAEMKRLTEAVDATNKLVAEVAKDLCQALPDVESTASALGVRAEKFAITSREQLQGVERETLRMCELVAATLKEGEAKLKVILEASNDALSHLQFQDPCAQSLRIVEPNLRSAVECVGRLMRDAGVVDVLVPPLEEGFCVATSNRARSAGEVAILSGEPAPPAGDVLLF
jgi:methyl-accepting chemotaxis protein